METRVRAAITVQAAIANIDPFLLVADLSELRGPLPIYQEAIMDRPAFPQLQGNYREFVGAVVAPEEKVRFRQYTNFRRIMEDLAVAP